MPLKVNEKNPNNWLGTHLQFVQQLEVLQKRKTEIWMVCTSDGIFQIGEVKWYSHWRKYCFYPEEKSIYEEVCLGEIAEFLVARTKEHRKKRKESLGVDHAPVP